MASVRVRHAAVVVGAAVVSAATLVGTPANVANAAALDPVPFMFTGAEQSYRVPHGITAVQVKAIGGPGGDKNYDGAGGYGAKLVAYLTVTPGQTLYVEVGGDGDGTSLSTSGWNGGGVPADTEDLAGYGGGASDVQLKPRVSATALHSRVVVAAGGGGAGSVPDSVFAIVGGNAGEDGEPPEGRHCGGPAESGCGGSAATRTAGGAAGSADMDLHDSIAATAGTLGSGGGGGSGGSGHGGSGGGGGGGWYGGGGGGGSELDDVAGGGGGGGSSGIGAGARLVSLTVATTRTPSITITPLRQPATQLTSAHIAAHSGIARFAFSSTGTATGFQCSLVKVHRTTHFARCGSPKKYRHLAPARYTFEVRAVGPGGADPTPAQKNFTIAG